MSTIMHHQMLCGFIEKVVNALLSMNLSSSASLVALEQKTLVVSLAELNFPLSLTVSDKQLLVTCITERSDCQIDTSLATLKTLKEEQQLTELIKQDKLNIVGDVKVAQQFADVFQQLDIDWQSEIASYIGDVPTYKLGRFHQWLLAKVTFAKQQVSADASEWLLHEKRVLVSNGELQQLYGQIQQAQQAIQQIEQRISQLDDAINASHQESLS
ncbi:SCP2 sterol-binding domain-containing protein [Thalassotalea sp. 1_MG-2023]|uniref:ubiquinone biosynthesis accessory factor UbiJ n=1 Tax=Thalassotalea sp. 1_MG-2023 TaxID=3062680 RepID=UPI0026E14F81|nr:SCP2 sterol-binding domain-containing protein [Thalassotalea sp. 1_MG-2023]MDO6425406.1 SCP2 sterol-binding domain-containing protein [Thalassotalea sp. 1_MG-2023]